MASRLVVMRHAKSDYPAGVADHDRPLNARGERDALRAGPWLRDHRDDLVTGSASLLVSSARRTQRTWELAGRFWTDLPMRVEPELYAADVTTVLHVAAAEAADTVVIVGHNPAMHGVVLHLAGGDPDGLLPSIAWKFPTCAIAALELDALEPWSYQTGTLRAVRLARDE